MIPSGIRLGAWDYLKWKHIVSIKDKKERQFTMEVIAGGFN
jgi:hypothetical protein